MVDLCATEVAEALVGLFSATFLPLTLKQQMLPGLMLFFFRGLAFLFFLLSFSFALSFPPSTSPFLRRDGKEQLCLAPSLLSLSLLSLLPY